MSKILLLVFLLNPIFAETAVNAINLAIKTEQNFVEINKLEKQGYQSLSRSIILESFLIVQMDYYKNNLNLLDKVQTPSPLELN